MSHKETRGPMLHANGRITMELVFITPEMAAVLLTFLKPEKQRSLRKDRVFSYAKDMLEGRWTDDTSPICFHQDGWLANGQHRLYAIIKSGKGQWFWIWREMTLEEILNIDNLGSRTAGDRLKISGISNYNPVSTIARIVLAYDTIPGNIWVGGSFQAAITKSEIGEFVAVHNRDLQAVLPKVSRMQRLSMNTSCMGAFAYIAHRDSPNNDVLDEWLSGLVTGANIGLGDSRLVLRDFWTRQRDGKGLARWGGQQSNLFNVIRLWNRWVDSEYVSRINYAQRTDLPMPKVK